MFGALNPEDRDSEFWQSHIDLPLEDLQKTWGSRQKISEIMAFGVAAIRETFEEAGVFLARKKDDRNYYFEKI